MSIETTNIFMTRNQDKRFIYIMNKIAFSYVAFWLQWLQFWLIHEISSTWASPFLFRNLFRNFYFAFKMNVLSKTQTYRLFIELLLWKPCYRHKAFIVSVGLWNRKKTEFQCLLRLEVDIDFNRNTTYSSEKEATTFLWWHTGI